jgi:DNA-binding transcriptional ArsR family regulator
VAIPVDRGGTARSGAGRAAAATGDPFGALGDPNRRQIVERLGAGGRSVQELADELPISRPAVSRHLRLLREAGLVTEEPRGTRRIYCLHDEGVEAVRAYLDRVWGEDRSAPPDRRREPLTSDPEPNTRSGEAEIVAAFVPGLELSRAFFDEVVEPLLARRRHSAARLGEGSEVIGFDTPRSTDHGWGPRLQVFVDAADVAEVRATIDERLPETFRGWPVRFGWDDVPVSDHVAVDTLAAWLEEALGFDPRHDMASVDWLATPQQLLLQLTAGAVFHDGSGELEQLRERLRWYPDDVWLWVMGCQWTRIGQEEAFIGRTAEVGDELGSEIVMARLSRDLIRLCFLLERRYAPYTKWLGSAFARLDAAAEVGPLLRRRAIVEASAAVARRQNALGVADPQDPSPRHFYGRPYDVIGAERFAQALFERVRDPWLRSLPPIGAIDQFADSTDLVTTRGIKGARALLTTLGAIASSSD